MIETRDLQHNEPLSREAAGRTVGGISRFAGGADPMPCYVGYEAGKPLRPVFPVGDLSGGSIGDTVWPGPGVSWAVR